MMGFKAYYNIITFNQKPKMKPSSPTDYLNILHDNNLGLKSTSKKMSHLIYASKDWKMTLSLIKFCLFNFFPEMLTLRH